jgi:YVTN family beta-propeller protein
MRSTAALTPGACWSNWVGVTLTTPAGEAYVFSVVELPSGTVTLLFTDIEGSTRLLKQLGARYGEVLAEHRRILRNAVEARGGREVDTQGDSFFFAFARANAAVGAAVTAQRALAGHAWPEGGEVRVRMGLHTGEPAVGDERYVGLSVHRAARIGAVAHGGQVLLSGATRELVEDEVDGVSIRDLGSYQLKDIDRPERLYQLDIEGLQTDFPPLRAANAAQARPQRRRLLLLAAGVIAGAVAISIFAFTQGSGRTSIKAATGDSVAFVDSRSGRIVANPGVGATPTRVAVGAGAIWVANTDGDSVSRINPVTKAVVQTITAVGGGPAGITIGGGDVWVTNSLDGTVTRIDPTVNAVVGKPIAVGNDPVGIVFAAGSVWVANTGDGTTTRINGDTGAPAKKLLPVAATEFAYGAGSLWATLRATNQVEQIDPATGDEQGLVTVGNGAAGIAFGYGAVWVANSLDGTVTRIDPQTNTVAATIPNVGNGPTGVIADARGVWVSNQFDGTLARIDPRRNEVVENVGVGNRPQGLATSGHSVLVAVRPAGAGHRGGSLTMRMNGVLDSLDPSIAYANATWQLLRMTGDGLVAFDQASGLAGSQIVPDLAVSLPPPTNGGRTYTFRLRPNIRYSNGKPIKPSDMRATFERYYRVGKLPVSYYDDIVGAAACRKHPKGCVLKRGIVSDDAARTVTFHLVRPDPEFLVQLALPFANLVPAGTPAREAKTRSLPGTGPYVIASYRPKHVLTLVRNKYFHEWSQAAQPDGYPDKVVVRIGGTGNDVIDDVIHGRADVASTLTTERVSKVRLATVMTRYPSQVHPNPYPTTGGLFLNTRLAPFNHLDARRAVSYAVDRAAAVQNSGGTQQATPSCQILPPDFPGYRRYCPYTAGSTTDGVWTAPDLPKARALVARSGTRGMKVTIWTTPGGIGPFAVRVLRSLGYRAVIKSVSAAHVGDIQDSRNRVQIGYWAWYPDYVAASAFLNPLFACASFVPDSQSNQNTSEFCNPGIDRQIRHALAEQTTNPSEASSKWEQIDRQIVDQAPVVPLTNGTAVDVLSKRVSNYQYNIEFGVLIDQLWVH